MPLFGWFTTLSQKTVIKQLGETFQGRNLILVSVHAIEGTGVNAIPEALADLLAEYLGWRTDSGIIQTNIVGHTGANGFSRLARQNSTGLSFHTSFI